MATNGNTFEYASSNSPDIPGRPHEYINLLSQSTDDDCFMQLMSTLDNTVRAWLTSPNALPLIDADATHRARFCEAFWLPRHGIENLVRSHLDDESMWQDLNVALTFSSQLYGTLKYIGERADTQAREVPLSQLSPQTLRRMFLAIEVLMPLILEWKRVVGEEIHN